MLFRTYTSNSGLSRRVDSIQTREGIETVTSTEITSSLHHAFQLSCNCQGMMRTRMMGDRKDFPTVFIFTFAVVLSCCQASSSFLPHVTRTSDAVIIDFEGSGYAAPIQSKNVYANPAFAPQPFFNPYAMMYQHPQQMMYNGWSFFYGHPGRSNPAGVPSTRQYEEEEVKGKQTVGQQIQISGATTTTAKPTTTTTKAPAPAPAPAIQCGRGPNKFPYHDHDHDRTAISERISLSDGGEPEVVVQAKKNAWPFVVTLKNSKGVLFCAATLISDTRVLLAAQCMEQLSLIDMSGVTVLFGVTGPTNIQMTRRISKLYLHSKYNAANYANDIAIIILDSPVVLSRSVAPACLPPASSDPDQYADKKAIILGWGTADINTPSENLLQAKVDLVANSECRSDSDFGRFVSDTSLCVSSTDVFTCAGDIGGPVVNLPAPGTWTVIGINSYTKSDCTATGLKTRVSAYRDWIDQYMN
ncbi:chymotrypsin-like elastase family member 2A isoform X1 [Daphnia pulicaria]|uniref:chymotrypsin-like elastase family member 2A isoform X1 n=1 Tax=Daphnia pulicaria TaxID=35523 RepID=UPI001EEBC16B|nr:chymotrypsin-like elastase family member 2A isoform X1 [Daphnia pulicaria]